MAADVAEVMGVEVDLSALRLDDFELSEALADVMSADGDAAALPAAVRYMRALLGAQYAGAKAALREARGGRLTLQDMTAFCRGVLEAAGAKNS